MRDVLPAFLVLLGLCVSIPLTATLQVGPRPGPLAIAAWALGLTLPLLWRRRWPGTVAAVVAVVFIAGQVVAVPENLIAQIAVMIALYTIGAEDPDRRRAWLSRGAVIALVAIWIVIALVGRQSYDAALGGGSVDVTTGGARTALILLSTLGNVVVLAAATALGEVAWYASTRQEALQASTVQLRAEQDRVAAQAIALDRMRIARELHDVIAHHVSMIGVQASVARRLAAADPGRSAAAMEEVEGSARRAITDLGTLLTTLREDAAPRGGPGSPPGIDGEAAPSTTGLHRVPDLVDEARRGGLRVTLHLFEGSADPAADAARVSPVAGYALYRLVQEAMTNTRKHAHESAEVDVRIEVRGDGDDDGEVLSVVVTDGGGEPGDLQAEVWSGAPVGTGLGLTGMHERITAAGGRSSAGRGPEGFAVRAALPLDTSPPAFPPLDGGTV